MKNFKLWAYNNKTPGENSLVCNTKITSFKSFSNITFLILNRIVYGYLILTIRVITILLWELSQL